MFEQNNSIELTVFTATYNRADLLPRLFESLLQQEYKNFEWVVVDDGSSDNTESVIEGFTRDSWFPIKFILQDYLEYLRGKE